MSTLPDITQALCQAAARHDWERAKALSLQAAAKMGPPRSTRIKNAFACAADSSPVHLKAWYDVRETRGPFVPASVATAISTWLGEVKHSDALVAAGERVLPLLLVGETRCGKTSTICSVSAGLGMAVKRLSLSGVVDSHMGDCARLLRAALAEASGVPNCMWIVDEIDAISGRRLSATGADHERRHAVDAMLVELESLPPGMALVATSNDVDAIDGAVLARFTVVEFPAWASLSADERSRFALSHGFAEEACASSYAEAVKACRARRVAKLIEAAEKDAKP